jgi:hypothetical protein
MPKETITLTIESAKKKAFLQMIKLLDYVKVESKKDLIKQFIRNAPKSVPVSEEEINAEIKKVRRKRMK